MSAFAFRPGPGAPLGDLLAAGVDTIDLTGTPGWQYVAPGPAWTWLMALMPDGSFWEGAGATSEEAKADARRNWVRWKRGNAGPLAVDGRAYQRRLANRRRR